MQYIYNWLGSYHYDHRVLLEGFTFEEVNFAAKLMFGSSFGAVCTSIAVLLHYIFLTAFFLMLSEGCIIAQVVLRPFDKRNSLPALLGTSYGIPLVVVSISAAASKLNGYGNDKLTGLRSVCVLLPVFGITWLFGVFAVNRDAMVFQYLFVIFNSLQGVLIFIFQCILDWKVQEAFKARRTWLFATEVSFIATEMKARSFVITQLIVIESNAT
ncbi:AGRD1-like protein [Mya arenaria]|uniref:AGRD1-like protein n=1 Tax=Mya arenaria TaxID=6604 RepID=A0ABY7ECY2_MYAAR|nr:AGRD1-like protein [Mya arenaria]